MLPKHMTRERLDELVAAVKAEHVWVRRVCVEDESNCKTREAILLDHPHYAYEAPFAFNQFNTLSMCAPAVTFGSSEQLLQLSGDCVVSQVLETPSGGPHAPDA
jgi:hypothetical protein